MFGLNQEVKENANFLVVRKFFKTVITSKNISFRGMLTR